MTQFQIAMCSWMAAYMYAAQQHGVLRAIGCKSKSDGRFALTEILGGKRLSLKDMYVLALSGPRTVELGGESSDGLAEVVLLKPCCDATRRLVEADASRHLKDSGLSKHCLAGYCSVCMERWVDSSIVFVIDYPGNETNQAKELAHAG